MTAAPALRSGSQRRVERIEGLGAFGSAALGPFRLRTPVILDAAPGGGEPAPATDNHLSLTSEPAGGPGLRRTIVTGNGIRWSFEFPIPTPENSPGEGYFYEAAGEISIVHSPVSTTVQDRWTRHPPSVIVVANARALWAEGEPFVQTIQAIRDAAGPGPLLWFPRVALPNRLALLAYLGGDILDSTEALFRAAEGQFLDAALGRIEAVSARAALACACPGCGVPSSLARHAEHALRTELARVRSAAEDGRLRDLVESRLPSEPRLAELLRYADRLLAAHLEETTPVAGGGSVRYVLAEAFRRPEARRFRQRFLDRYRPPPTKRILLVVPCSETKPYRLSPSHRRFARALEGLSALERVHIVSVTSPLGLVPRELEDVYPARQYDIPVTGEWSEPERNSVLTALNHLLKAGAYQRLVFHLDAKEYSFLPPIDTLPVDWTVEGGRAGSAGSLRDLRRVVELGLKGIPPVEGGPLAVVREELEAVAAVQFGAEAAQLLMSKPLRLAGRPWFQRLTDGHATDLATLREERGLFQLTVAGGQRLVRTHPLEVEIAADLRLEGDLFCPGVIRADPSIRRGDSVLLTSQGSLMAVGEATVPGRWMAALQHGLAVRVRHRVHPDPRLPGAPTGA